MERIIETEKIIDGKKNRLKVIEDVGVVPGEISIDSVEIVPPPNTNVSRWSFHAWDIRVYLSKADMYFGLGHSEALLAAASKIPDEWRKYHLYFPGTILQGTRNKELYMPYVQWEYEGWVLYFTKFFRRGWLFEYHRFLRWRR